MEEHNKTSRKDNPAGNTPDRWSSERMASACATVVRYPETDKRHLPSDFCLRELAGEPGISVKAASEYIHCCMERNFHGFIHRIRTGEAGRLLCEAAAGDAKVSIGETGTLKFINHHNNNNNNAL
jgi:hypothetical protein